MFTNQTDSTILFVLFYYLRVDQCDWCSLKNCLFDLEYFVVFKYKYKGGKVY